MQTRYLPRKLAITFVCILLLIALLHATGIMHTDRVGHLLPFFCPFKAITGIPCPGCGMTRAVLSVARGDFDAAYHDNPFVFLLLFIVVISVMPELWRGRVFGNSRFMADSFFSIALAGILIFWFFQRLLPSV